MVRLKKTSNISVKSDNIILHFISNDIYLCSTIIIQKSFLYKFLYKAQKRVYSPNKEKCLPCSQPNSAATLKTI